MLDFTNLSPEPGEDCRICLYWDLDKLPEPMIQTYIANYDIKTLDICQYLGGH
uniref:Uncharacterized protein n=1 Tax=Arion vulgaris TaxID=1028688 RepID=A0A0B7B3Q1_9EUPU